MPLQDFQKALYEAISDPEFCKRIREEPTVLVNNYELTEKERHRLIAVSKQKGMATNCTLYRINRVTPIYTMMPYTCKLLESQLLPILSEFWGQKMKTNLQFKDEVRSFYEFLKGKSIKIRYFADILSFEGKLNELRFSENYESRSIGQYILNPRFRLVQFSNHPTQLFEFLTDSQAKSRTEIEQGEFYLLIENTGEELSMKIIANEIGRILSNIEVLHLIPKGLLNSGLVTETGRP